MATRFLPLSFLLAFLLAVAPACADTILYENGSLNESLGGLDIDAALIGSGATTTDSFTLTGDSIITGLEVAVLVDYGATPLSLLYLIGTSPFGDSVSAGGAVVGEFDVTDSLLCSPCSADGGLSLYSLSIPISPGLALGAGTYWLTLDHFSLSGMGENAYWYQNDGPSTAYYYDSSTAENVSLGSEWFEIIGNAAPEPSSFTFVVLGGVLLAGWKCRARRLVRGSHR